MRWHQKLRQVITSIAIEQLLEYLQQFSHLSINFTEYIMSDESNKTMKHGFQSSASHDNWVTHVLTLLSQRSVFAWFFFFFLFIMYFEKLKAALASVNKILEIVATCCLWFTSCELCPDNNIVEWIESQYLLYFRNCTTLQVGKVDWKTSLTIVFHEKLYKYHFIEHWFSKYLTKSIA